MVKTITLPHGESGLNIKITNENDDQIIIKQAETQDIEMPDLSLQNYRLCTLLGMCMAVVSNPTEENKNWMFKAIEEVIYKNNPIPMKEDMK